MGIFDFDIVDAATLRLKLSTEVTHRGKEIGNLLLMLAYISRFFQHLHLRHGIADGIKAIKRRRIGIQLVSENDDEISDVRAIRPIWSGNHELVSFKRPFEVCAV